MCIRDRSGTETDQDTSSTEEEEDRDTLTGLQSTSESTVLSSEEDRASLLPPIGMKQPAAFLTQIMGDFMQKSHATPAEGTGVQQSRGEGAGGDDPGIIQAVKSGDMRMLKKHLRGRHNLGVTDSNRRTPLHIACSFGRLEMVQVFIEIGMNVDACSVAGQTPLHEACIGGHYGILRRLLPEVSDLDAVDTNGLSAAHYCALNGEVKCLNLLCDQVSYMHVSIT